MLMSAGGIPVAGLSVPLEPPRARYDIEAAVVFDTTELRIAGTETISFINDSSFPIERLTLNWTEDSLQTLDMTANGAAVELIIPPSGDKANDPIIVLLPQAVSPGEKLEIRAAFDKKFIFEQGDNRHLLTRWYPRIYWGMETQDDFAVRVENSSDFTLATSGLYDADTKTYRADGVRQFGLYFLKNGNVIQRETDGVTVRLTHTAAAEECARLVMETAVDAVSFYIERFGFFPTRILNIAQGADNPMGGYPAATNLVVVHGLEKMAERDELHWRWITAHELGHQYWFEYVMPEFPDQIGWLMIGLGIYADREYIRDRGLAPDKHLGLMNRFIDGIREGLDTRADIPGDYVNDIDFDFNNVVIHGKGYSIISALNRYLGDELFDRIHACCLREFAGKRMSGYDFQKVCERESGQNLDWFFDQWVRTTRYPSYEITSKECTQQDGRFVSEITVEKKGTLDMPVPVTVYFADKAEQTVFTERLQPVSVLRFASAAALDSAVVDAGHEIALVVPPPNPEEIEIRRKLSSLPARAEIDSLPVLVGRALATDIEQTSFWGKLGRQLYDWGLYAEALAVFERRTGLLESMESEWVRSAYGWQGLLLDLLGRRSEAVAAYEKALAVTTDREFAYDGDPVTVSRAWLEERLKTPFMNANEK